MKALIALLALLVVLFIAGCSEFGNREVTNESATIQGCPSVPKKVCIADKEPYVEKVPINYTFMYGVISDISKGTFLAIDNYGTEQITKIKNFDDSGGTFIVKHHYRTLKKEGTKSISNYTNSGETKEFRTTFDTALGEDVVVTTMIIPPIEIRYKEVIKYKDVERCTCE